MRYWCFFCRLPHISYHMHSTFVKQKFLMILNFHFLINKKEQQFPEGDFIKYICTTLPFLRIFCDSVPTLRGCEVIMKIVSLSNVYILSIHVMIFCDSVSSLRLQHKRKVKHLDLDFFMSKIKEMTESEVKNIMKSESNVGNFLISFCFCF